MSLNTDLDNLIGQVFDNTLVSGLTLSQSATYRKRVTGALNIATGVYAETVTDTTVNIIRTTFKNAEIAQSAGTILTTDAKFYIRPQSGVTLDAMKDDRIIFDNKTYTVKNAEKKALGPTEMVFIIQAGVVENE